MSELPNLPAGAVTNDALLYIVDGDGNSRRLTGEQLKTFINTNPSVVPSSNPWRGATVKRTSDLPVSNLVETPIPWQATTEDTDSIWSAGNPTRLTVPAGVTRVRLSGSIQYEASTSGVRFLLISKNGSDFEGRVRDVIGSSGTTGIALGMSASTADVAVSPGDYFELRAYHNGSSSLDLISGTALWFSMAVVEVQP